MSSLYPTRWFSHLTPLQTPQQFMAVRDSAYSLLVGKLQAMGMIPSDFDIRTLTPDDLKRVDPNCGFYEEWRVSLGHLKNTDGVTGNRVVDGIVPEHRYIVFYGASIESPRYVVPETRLIFRNGANIKNIWFLTEMCAGGFRRFTSDIMPLYGSRDRMTIELATVKNTQLIVDQLFGLIAEPLASTITGSQIRA